MSRSISPKKIVFSSFFMLVFSVLAFGQSSDLQTDLRNSFKKFNLMRINQTAARRNISSGQSLIISTGERNFELNLMPNDLRARNYRAETTDTNGISTLERSETITFKGNIAGEVNSEVRMTIDGTKIEGYFSTTDGEKFYIEPAQNYSRSANAEDLVVYKPEDLSTGINFDCHSEIGEKIERGKEMVVSRPETTQSLKVLELATEADFSFVSELGGAAQANNEILSILNMVEGTYSSELNLSISVVYQHTWTTADEFNGANTNTLLTSFQSYWNTHFSQTQYPRDAAHIFTARSNMTGSGLAYIGAVCRKPLDAYGLSGRINSVPANNLITAHEIGHNVGANHVDAVQGCASTVMLSALSDTFPLSFCAYSRSEISNYMTANSTCLSERNLSTVCSDFDGDRKSDIAVFRPSNGVWYRVLSANNQFDFKQFGASTDKLVPADYDGDGKVDVAVFRGGTWYRLKSSTNTFDGIAFGIASDIPVPADFDGDGKADLAVFRPAEGVWHRLTSSNNIYSGVQFGQNGDMPLPEDFDGDGKADINVFRPSNGGWYRMNSQNSTFFAVQFGSVGDKPLMADFDGDSKADVAVFRPSDGNWYRITSSNNVFSGTTFGVASDVPVPADFDGDGKTDISVFRPSDGNWYRLNSSNNQFVVYQFGITADVPVATYYNQ